MSATEKTQSESSNSTEPDLASAADTTPGEAEVQVEVETEPNSKNPRRSLRFWAVFVSLCMISFVSALDATIVTTALPTITREIGGESQYAWIANCFVIASTAPQPLFAQLSNIFGRRNPMLVALTIFGLGSGVAGGASNVAMLIAGRSIQGIGVAGLYVLLDVICCDLVPLRARAKYLGVMLGVAGIAMPVGPVIGGAIAERDWRWVFYLNVPFAVLCIASVIFFMKVNYRRSPTWLHALKRVDFTGNLIFIPSIIAITYGLVSGGIVHPWSSFRIILPLTLGILGWVAFHIQQRFVPEPSIPWRLFANRTSASAYLQTFCAYITFTILIYFVPVFFMGAHGISPLQAGVRFLPLCIGIVPFGILTGFLVEKTGQYVPFHFLGHGFMALGMGLFSMCDENSGAEEWASYQILMAIGGGMILSTMVTAILAALPEKDVAVATGAFSFLRQFGMIWGVTIGATVFNQVFDVTGLEDQELADSFARGAAYGESSSELYDVVSDADRAIIVGEYVRACARVFQVSAAFAALGFVLVFAERRLELRNTLNTEFGLETGEKRKDEEKVVVEKGSEERTSVRLENEKVDDGESCEETRREAGEVVAGKR